MAGPFESASNALRDLGDILGRARSPVEALKTFVPPSLVRRRILNEHPGTAESAAPAAEIAASLRRLTRRLEGEALSEDGRSIHYGGLEKSEAYAELEHTAALLRGLPAGRVGDRAEELAFWVNLYNVLVVHGIIAFGIRASVMEVPSFFSTVAYRIGEHSFTPDEIENGILRRNGKHPATGLRLFRKSDPRLAFCVEAVDPRVHMALVCAARSCPPIAFYDAADIDEQLELASRNFVQSDVEIDGAKRQIVLSVIFRYYLADFGGERGLRRFLLEHLDSERAAELERVLDEGYRVSHRRYDWSLNGVRDQSESV